LKYGRVGHGDDGAPEGRARLVFRTLNDKGHLPPDTFLQLFSMRPDSSKPSPYYVLRVRDFGAGAVEGIAYRGDLTPKRRKLEDRLQTPKDSTRDKMEVADLQRSERRARRLVRHRLMGIQADRLLTLTYRENKEDLQGCWKDFHRFRRMMFKTFPNFAYVVVPERQKRGAWHFHLGVKGFYNVGIVRAFWRKAISGDRKADVGNIDITSPRKGGAWQRVKLARYLAKYLTKDMDVQTMHSRRFASSHNIQPPTEVEFYVPVNEDAFYFVAKIFERIAKRGFSRRFESDGPFPLIWLSTY
jgi:hypothetical protein